MGKRNVAQSSDWNVQLVAANTLQPYENNTRTHSPEQIDAVMASMVEFGFTKPVLVMGDSIVAGHGAVLAALRLAEEGTTIKTPGGKPLPKGTVPVIDCTGWTDAQRRAYVIADNALAERAGWDMELLASELLALEGEGFDTSLIGFTPEMLAEALGSGSDGGLKEGLTDPDDVPDAPKEPVARLGDVWLLGKHRLVCGDSTDADVVAKCLNGVTPHLMVTDPPYGVEYDASWRNDAAAKGLIGQKKSTRATGKVLNDDKADWREAYALFPGDVIYVWHAGNKCHIVGESLLACGFAIRAQIIWSKSNFAISRGHYHPQHEPCFYAVKGGATGHWSGDRKQSTIWNIPKPSKSETGHSTQKPVECMRRPMENNSSPGQAVYEPFSGSGTTIIAAEQIGRVCHAIELNPAYVDVAVMRWQEFTGERATLEATGQAFADLAAERVPQAA